VNGRDQGSGIRDQGSVEMMGTGKHVKSFLDSGLAKLDD
jgi:hypothetical protein